MAFVFYKKNQSAYKPGSVLTYLFEMRSACHLSAPAVTDVLYRSTLQRVVNNTENSDEQPSNVGIHELSTSDVYSPHVTTWLVSSYLTFSPLPSVCIQQSIHNGRFFSSTLVHPRGRLPIKKQNALCCPDFPPALQW